MKGDRGPAPGAEPEVGGPPIQAHPLSRALRDLVRAGDEVDHVFAQRLQLNLTDYAAMNHLANTGTQQLGPVELGEMLGISSGSATGLVDRLESAGHVRRQPHPTDRRRLVVAPTESALADIFQLLRPMLNDLDAFGDQFTEEEQLTIERYLRGAALRLRAYAASLGQDQQRPRDAR